MAVTQFTTDNIQEVRRNDLDVTTTGEAVIRKVIAGTNVTISSTGVDAGTGDVTINASPAGAMSTSTTNSSPLAANTFYNLDATSGNLTALLPTAVGIAGQIIRVRKSDTTSNTITMNSTSSQTINESVASSVVLRKNGWSFDFQSDGANWKIV